MAGHVVKYGKHRERRSFARISEVLELPNLIEIQTDSYQWFLDEGLREMFEDILPIDDFQGNLSLEFVDYELKEPKYTVEEARAHDANYSAPLHVTLRLTNRETGEIKSQEVFFGDFPLMTEMGTFIINGAERVIVSQLVRSPGVYFHGKVDKNGKEGFGSTVIPNRGAWLEMETDAKDISYVRIDRTRKIPLTVLVRALGFGSDDTIFEIFGDSDRYEADDYAGSLVYKFREQVPMVVMTKDHDYLQLVSDEYNVRAWMVQARQEKAEELCDKYYGLYGLDKASVNLPEKTFEFTAETVYSEEGVWPRQITDLKGIQGDTSDNIPGVRGVASAAPLLLGEYGTVEHIYEVIHEAEQDKKQLKELQDFWKNCLGISRSPYKSLTKTGEEGELCGEAAARLSKELATIKTDIPLDFELEDFSASCCREEVLKEWCRKLDIKTASVFGKS